MRCVVIVRNILAKTSRNIKKNTLINAIKSLDKKQEVKLLTEERTTQALPVEEINQLTKTLVDTMANGTPKEIAKGLESQYVSDTCFRL